MARKAKKAKNRNAIAVAMRKRHPRKQVFRHRNERRAKEHKNSWQREWE